MKKLILSSMALLFSVSVAFAQDNGKKAEKHKKAKMDLQELPQEVQDFVSQHFEGVKIRSAEREKDMLNFGNGELYEVVLANGVKLDFNKAGAVTEIESKDNAKIPEGALPSNIYSYVEENYDAHIVNWEVDSDDQEVELSDGTDLEFDPNGEFMRED
jgi:hypothetical protein